jgi:positive regulator of sigma E activity
VTGQIYKSVPKSISSDVCSAIGVVRECEGNRVAVEVEAPPRCKGCDGACLWYRLPLEQRLTVTAGVEFPVGTRVAVTLPPRYLLLGAAAVYGLPLVALLAGGAAAAALFEADWAAAAGAAGALAGAFVAVSPLKRRLEQATLRRLAVRVAA